MKARDLKKLTTMILTNIYSIKEYVYGTISEQSVNETLNKMINHLSEIDDAIDNHQFVDNRFKVFQINETGGLYSFTIKKFSNFRKAVDYAERLKYIGGENSEIAEWVLVIDRDNNEYYERRLIQHQS